MTTRFLWSSALVLSVGAMACGVHQTAEPSLTGPSGFATSLTVTATPDNINRDGSSQSTILVTARNAAGQALSGLSVHLEMAVGGVTQDFGTVANRNLVTDANGLAATIFTAPSAPPAGVVVSETVVTIRATPVGTNAQASGAWSSADITLTPQGVILPPDNSPNGPVASFTVSPASPVSMVPVQFDASASCGSPGCTGQHQIVSYAWSFGDGGTASGRTATHTFTAAHDFTVELKVTNDVGQTATKTAAVSVTNPETPSAEFVFSPSAPVVGQNVVFNGDLTKVASGHTITRYTWLFGDGTRANGLEVTHAYSQAGSYDVTLNVSDDAGQESTAKHTVVVGTGSPTASFTISPAPPFTLSPNVTINFDANGSTAAAGATISTYTWSFGDGTGAGPSSSPTTTKDSSTYVAVGTYTVTLIVTDSAGRTSAPFTQTVKIQ